MKMQCPYCKAEIELPESPVARHQIPCPVCRKKFFTVGEFTFRYGVSLPKTDPAGPDRVECPYCGQHYNVKFEPLNGMLGCVKCLKVFAVPSDSSRPTVDLSALDMVSEARLAPNPRDTSSVRPYPPPSSPSRPAPERAPAVPPPAAGIAPQAADKPASVRSDAVTLADAMFPPPVPPSQQASPPRVRVFQPESLGTSRPVSPSGASSPDADDQPIPVQTPTGSFRLVRPDDTQEN